MAFLKKKYCDICEEKIGLLSNKKLEDGNMCKSCAKLLSPYVSDRRKTSVEDIKKHLEYRENNKKDVANFKTSKIIGGYTRVLLDEEAQKFIVTSSDNWKNENPDVVNLSQVTSCSTNIYEYKTELTYKDKDNKDVSFSPRRYDIEYDFYMTIYVDSPWFEIMGFGLNDKRVYMYGSGEYRMIEQQSKEIEDILTRKRQGVPDNADMSNSVSKNSSPKTPEKCPFCGSTTIPNAKGCCEFCGGKIEG